MERFPLEEKAGANRVAVEALRPWVEQYLELLSEAGEMEFDASRLPSEPEEMAYLAATVLQVPALEKQALLAQSGRYGAARRDAWPLPARAAPAAGDAQPFREPARRAGAFFPQLGAV